jgi:hypothetical protein
LQQGQRLLECALHKGRLLALLTIITEDWKGFPGPNAQAYLSSSSTMKKSLIILNTGVDTKKLFFFIYVVETS